MVLESRFDTQNTEHRADRAAGTHLFVFFSRGDLFDLLLEVESWRAHHFIGARFIHRRLMHWNEMTNKIRVGLN